MRSKEYWEKRAIDDLVASEKSVLEYEKLLQEAYEYALIQIKKEIESFFQKYAKDNKIPYAEVRRRLDSVEKKDFQTLLKEWYKLAERANLSDSFKQRLKELASRVYITRLESLEASIQFQIEQLKSKQYKWMTDLLALNYAASYYNSYYTAAQGFEVAVNFATVDKLGVEKAIKQRWDGRNYSDSVWADKDKLIKAMTTILPRSFSMGQNSRYLGELIAKEMGTSKNRGRTLARTEINYLCNQASLDVYKACGIDDYEFLATLDMRTSEICRGLDGTVHKVSQAKVGVNYPPMHPNCRSTTIPKVEDEDIKDRIAKDSEGNNIKVPRRMSQEEYIKKYVPEDQQNTMLKFINKYYSNEG